MGSPPAAVFAPKARSFRKQFLTLFAVGVLAVPSLEAQTVYTTFGPGDSYNCCVGFALNSGPTPLQFMAGSFTYGGPDGWLLSTIRLAAFGTDFGDGVGDALISFLSGPDIATATPIESWVLSGWTFPAEIFSFTSVTGNPFVSGETYWLRATTGPSGGMSGAWNLNDQGLLGATFSLDGGASWKFSPGDAAPAWDVSAVSSAAVPEPASVILFGTGLAGLAGVGLFRRRRKVATA